MAALSEFKEILGDSYNPALHNDASLLRFLAARQNDVEKAKLMFINAQEWRNEQQVDKILNEFAFPEAPAVNEIYPRYFHKTDKLGRAIIINELTNLNMKDLLSCTTEERFLKEHIREIEKITKYRTAACAIKYPESNNQLFTIVDIKGVSPTIFPSIRNTIASIARIDTEYYPETLGCMAIINAPLLFTAVWGIIRNFLDHKTQSKIHIFGTNYKAQLLKLIDSESLPTYLGGSCQCKGGCRFSDSGPWNDGSVSGYPISFWEDFKKRDVEAEDESTIFSK